jgi:hypothetical protein
LILILSGLAMATPVLAQLLGGELQLLADQDASATAIPPTLATSA